MQINLWYYGENVKTSQALNRNTMFDTELFEDLDITLESKFLALKGYSDAVRELIAKYKDDVDYEYRIVIDEMNKTVKTFRKESENNFERITHLKLVK